MKEIFAALLAGLRRRSDGKLRNRFSVFLVCVVLSSLMWGSIKLTREYEAPVKYRVVPVNVPPGKILTGMPDSVVTLTLFARGIDLYSGLIFNRKNVLTVDLTKIRMQRNGEVYTGYMKSSAIFKSVAAQLPAGARLVAIDTDTLHFVFSKSFRRKVPVHPELVLDFMPQYQLYDSLEIRPDSVIVSGLRSVVDTIHHVSTVRKSIKGLNSNYSVILELEKPQVVPPVTLSTDSVTVTIHVEKFTEADIEVPVELHSGEKAVSYRTFPEKVKLTCRVSVRDYKRLDASLFTVAVDYAQALESRKNRVSVEVKRKPSFARVIRTDPEKVEILILR